VALPLPFIDPRLLVRALEDLHVLAQAASELTAVEARLTERFDALEDRADQLDRRLAAGRANG